MAVSQHWKDTWAWIPF